MPWIWTRPRRAALFAGSPGRSLSFPPFLRSRHGAHDGPWPETPATSLHRRDREPVLQTLALLTTLRHRPSRLETFPLGNADHSRSPRHSRLANEKGPSIRSFLYEHDVICRTIDLGKRPECP